MKKKITRSNICDPIILLSNCLAKVHFSRPRWINNSRHNPFLDKKNDENLISHSWSRKLTLRNLRHAKNLKLSPAKLHFSSTSFSPTDDALRKICNLPHRTAPARGGGVGRPKALSRAFEPQRLQLHQPQNSPLHPVTLLLGAEDRAVANLRNFEFPRTKTTPWSFEIKSSCHV